MSFLDRFRKKDDFDSLGDEGLPAIGGDETAMPPRSYEEGQSSPMPPDPSFEQEGMPMTKPASSGSRDIELVLAKLDAINAKLESLNARVAHLERIASGEDKRHEEW